MPTTRVRVAEIRAACFAEDLPILDRMARWDETECEAYFESGGQQEPRSRPVRFLCLHGGGSNAEVNRVQLARLMKQLGAGADATFRFFEGTRVYPEAEVDPTVRRIVGGRDVFGWYGVENAAQKSLGNSSDSRFVDALLDPSNTVRYSEAEAALDRLEAHVEASGPYDVLCGFSQVWPVAAPSQIRAFAQPPPRFYAADRHATPHTVRCSTTGRHHDHHADRPFAATRARGRSGAAELAAQLDGGQHAAARPGLPQRLWAAAGRADGFPLYLGDGCAPPLLGPAGTCHCTARRGLGDGTLLTFAFDSFGLRHMWQGAPTASSSGARSSSTSTRASSS